MSTRTSYKVFNHMETLSGPDRTTLKHEAIETNKLELPLATSLHASPICTLDRLRCPPSNRDMLPVAWKAS